MHARTQAEAGRAERNDFRAEMRSAEAGLTRLVTLLDEAATAVSGTLRFVVVRLCMHACLCSLCAHMHIHLM
jgi:hypothetical protein